MSEDHGRESWTRVLDQLLDQAKDFENCCAPEEALHEESGPSLHDVALSKLQVAQEGRDGVRNLINMKRMQPFLTGMQHLEKVLAALNFQHVRKVMSCVWFPVGYLIETTNNEDKALDFVLDVYEKLGRQVPSLIQYTRLFKKVPEVLVYLYEDVLAFHMLTYKLFSLRIELWKKLYRPVWTSLENSFGHLEDSLKKHKEFIENVGSMFRDSTSTLEDVDALRRMEYDGNIHETHNGMEIWQKADQYYDEVQKRRESFTVEEETRKAKDKVKVLEWISASKITGSLHKKFQGMRICRDTGRWLFRKHIQVIEWMKEEQIPESVMWIQGKRGFGKSVLASLLIDELLKLKAEERERAIPSSSKIYYFYCQDGIPSHSTCFEILKGILHQMVEADEDFLPICVEKCDAIRRDKTLENIELAKSLIEICFEYNPRQYVIIDGLDECESPDELRNTATFFMKQTDKCDLIKQGQLRVLFTSDYMPELSQEGFMPGDEACVKLMPEDNKNDIRAYVRKRIPEFDTPCGTRQKFNLEDDTKQQIEDNICSHSKGMFLYAHLAVEYLLQQPTKGAVCEKSKGEVLPKGLKELYEKLLGALKNTLENLDDGEEHWKLAKFLLGWLVCAKRPLDWHEMQAILSYKPSTQEVDFDNKMVRHHAEKYLGSLVHILDGDRIQIIHSTARRHIIQNKHIDKPTVLCELTTRCLQYLCLLSASNEYDDETRLEKSKLGWFSFQDYACSQWRQHVSTLPKECGDSFLKGDQGQQFGIALKEFVVKHEDNFKSEEDLKPGTRPGLEQALAELAGLIELDFYEDLRRLWIHMYCHERGDYGVLNSVGIQAIEEALEKSRKTIETNLTPNMLTNGSDTVADYYGAYLFKCERVLCRFFYVGYDSAGDRKAHIARHDRPFPCPVQDCTTGPTGFISEKDRNRHVQHYHPEQREGLAPFAVLQRRQGELRFPCHICGDAFTRKITLQGHERSHFGARPFICGHCAKAFARVSDLKRHEGIHRRERRAVIQGRRRV